MSYDRTILRSWRTKAVGPLVIDQSGIVCEEIRGHFPPVNPYRQQAMSEYFGVLQHKGAIPGFY